MYLLLILICVLCNIHRFLFKRIIFVVSGYLESAFSRKCDNIYEREIRQHQQMSLPLSPFEACFMFLS